MAAGIATLKEIGSSGFYDALEEISARLAKGLVKAAADAGIPATLNRVGSMLGSFFTDKAVKSFSDAKTSDLEMFSAYYKGMLEKGIYLAPTQFEALFVSSAHNIEHIDDTVRASSEVLAQIRKT